MQELLNLINDVKNISLYTLFQEKIKNFFFCSDGYGHGVITDRLQVVADGEDTRMTEIEEPGTKSGEAFASILHFLPFFSYCKDMPWPVFRFCVGI